MTSVTASKPMRVPSFVGGGKIAWAEHPVPAPGPGQLLVQVKANALCGSERGQFYNGSEVTPGHEAAGIVVKAGPGTKTSVGARGVIFLMDFCGECRSCKLGFTNQCLQKRGDMGFNRDGGYGPFELINENIFFEVGDDLSFAEMTLLLDVMGTSSHCIRRARLLHPDIESILVSGAGPVGMGVLVMCKLLFGLNMPVYVTDISPWRLALVERLGGKPVNVHKAELSQALKGYGQPRVDLAIDGSGKSVARQAALEVLDKRGVLVCVGHGEEIRLDVSRDLIAPERAVLGSEYFTYAEFNANLALLRANRAYLSQIITHHFGVDQLENAFELFYKGETGKVIIEQ
jgi:threonine 3-dehydrogenase